MRLVGERHAVGNQPVDVGGIDFRRHGQHIVDRRRARLRVARIFIVKDVCAEDVARRRIDGVGGRLDGAVLFDHGDLFEIALVLDDLLVDGLELQINRIATDRDAL